MTLTQFKGLALIFATVGFCIVLAGCGPSINKEKIDAWATTVVKEKSPVEPTCKKDVPPPPVPAKGATDDQAAARYSSKLLDAYVAAKRMHATCATWAKGQR